MVIGVRNIISNHVHQKISFARLLLDNSLLLLF
jgi:hypothetical protein